MTTVAALLSRFALEAHPPPEVLTTSSFCLGDWASCAIAGAEEPVAASVRKMINAEGGGPLSSVIGQGARVPPRAAALANGTISHALDYDDTHFAHIGHPSVAVIPAVLALAEARGADGTQTLSAIALGHEASIAMGLWLGRSHYQAGFHQTSTAGGFGATIAAAKIAGLSDAQLVHALNLVATRASGLKAQFGSMGKPLNAGIAAANGVEAVLLAEAGLEGPPDAIGSGLGFGALHAGEDNADALETLGETWRLPEISFKMHACCHGLHAMIEAMRQLDLSSTPNHITIRTHPRWRTVCDIPDPSTALETKFSYRHVAAMVAMGADTAGLATYSDASANDPELQALRQNVELISDDGLAETAAHVTLTSASGTQTATADIATGLSEKETAARLRDKSVSLLEAEQASVVWKAVQDRDIPALTEALRSQAAPPEA